VPVGARFPAAYGLKFREPDRRHRRHNDFISLEKSVCDVGELALDDPSFTVPLDSYFRKDS
jgi:hypothetical protein